MTNEPSTFSLDRMFRAKSIAIAGASQRTNTYGNMVLGMLLEHRFPGPIYPVNPRYPEILGVTCYPDLQSLPGPVDLLYLALPAHLGPEMLEQAGAIGIGAAAIPGNGYADAGPEGEARQRHLVEIANRYSIPICGPNNLGFVNYHDRTVCWPTMFADIIAPGGIALISQSGSAGIAISQDPRELNLGYMVTAGNEANLTAADYLEYFVHDDRVQVVLMFLETLRDPATFARAAAEARRRGKRIAAVKVGKSETAQRMVAAHTGGLAGEDAVYEAFFRRHGILRAPDIDALIELGVLLSTQPTPPVRAPLGIISVSGGEAALSADLCAEHGLTLPALEPKTLDGLKPHLPEFQTPHNPVDAYGLGWDAERFARIVACLAEDSNIGTIVMMMDTLDTGGADDSMTMDVLNACVAAAETSNKQFIYVNNTSGGGINRAARHAFRDAGIPCLLGMREGIAAIGEWMKLIDVDVDVDVDVDGDDPEADEITDWRTLATQARSERERIELLREAGVPMVETGLVQSAEAAAAVATDFGRPVVMKGTATGLLHKTEHALVTLGIEDASQAQTAYHALTERLHAIDASDGEILIQPMVDAGVELILGARREGGFGVLLLVGVGGILVEVIKKASARIAPVDLDTARAMLDETPAGTLLRGTRGRGPYDIEAAAEAIVAFSEFAAGTGDAVRAIEINPLMVLEAGRGAIGVDAVFED